MNAADKSYFDSKFSSLGNKVDHLERGVYGDTRNNQQGLIERDEDKEQRLSTMEKAHDRIKYITVGLGMAAAGITKLLFMAFDYLTK